MKTLSLKNPWGHLICWGIKDIENRTWSTDYRGKILIHCSSSWDNRSRELSRLFTFKQYNAIPEEIMKYMFDQTERIMPTSAIIGQCEIVDIVRDSRSIWAEPDMYHWVIKNTILFESPILEVKGKLRLWEFMPD